MFATGHATHLDCWTAVLGLLAAQESFSGGVDGAEAANACQLKQSRPAKGGLLDSERGINM